jgi:hypothetical protein
MKYKIFKLLNKYQNSELLHFFLSSYSNSGVMPEEKNDKDYVFGAGNEINKQILQADGQWFDYLPEDELQNKGHETMSCTCHALHNVIEILAKRKWKNNWNKSDRFLAKLSGVTSQGNSMRRVLDTFNRVGAVNEDVWPHLQGMTWSEYYKPVPSEIQGKAQAFLIDYRMNYETSSTHPNALMEMLKYSPLYIAGYAWYKQGEYYRSYGQANHAFVLIGYEKGKCWYAYDSYSPHIKKLAWDFQFVSPRVIYLNRVNASFNMSAIKQLQNRGLKYIMRVTLNGEIYELTDDGLKFIDPQKWNDLNVKLNADAKKLIGITEDFYNTLIN